MTKREIFAQMTEGAIVTSEMAAFALAEIARLDAANDKRRDTMTKVQIANEELLIEMATHLTTEPKTATIIGEEMEISTQKASSLLRKLVERGIATVTEVKIPKRGIQKGYCAAE